MAANDKKAAQFIKAINNEADARFEKIKKETDDFIASELEKARAVAIENAKSVAKIEVEKLSEQSNTDTYKTRSQLINQIVLKRAEITDKVFSKAQKEIAEFTKKSEYIDFLKKSASSIKETIGEDAVIFIRPEDEKHKEALLTVCNSVEYDNTIKLGGCKGVSTKNSLRADDTLDSRFEQQKQEFYSYSGLSVI